jgi:outer membrane receptor protein involved in Fe transport
LSNRSGWRLGRLGMVVLAGAILCAPCLRAAEEEQDEGAPPPAPPEESTLAADSGVAVQTVCTNCNNADLSLGALGNDHVVVRCDGQLVPAGLPQIYLLSVMPPTMIDRITVNKGACRADYGGAAVGGGLEIERRDLTPGLTVNAATDIGDFGWRGNKLDLTGKHGKLGGYFVWTTARSDKIDPDGDTFPNLPSFNRTTYEAGVELTPARNHRIRLGLSRYEEAQRDGPASISTLLFPTPPSGYGYNLETVDLDRTAYDATYEWSGPGGSKLTVAGEQAKRDEDIAETEIPGSVCLNLLNPFEILQFCPSYLIDETHAHGAIAWSRPIGTQSKIAAGVSRTKDEYEVVDLKYNALNATLPIEFQLEESVTEDGAWVQGQTALSASLDLVAGLRYAKFDYDDNEDEALALIPARAPWLDIALPEGSKLLPRGALTWKPTDEITARFSAGTGFRPPTPAFSEVCCGRRYRGNRGVEIESSTSYGLELTYQPSPRVRLGNSAFLTDFDDLLVHMITLSQGPNTYQYVNVPKARKTSITLDGKFEGPEWLTTRVSYSWLSAVNRTSGDDILAVLEFPINVPTPATFHYHDIPTSVDGRGAVSLDFRLPLQVGLNLNAQYTGPTHLQFIDRDNPGDPALGNSKLATFLVDSDSFWAVNLGARKDFPSGLAFYAGVDNLFDEIQSDLGDWHFDTNWGLLRGRYVYAGLGFHLEKGRTARP